VFDFGSFCLRSIFWSTRKEHVQFHSLEEKYLMCRSGFVEIFKFNQGPCHFSHLIRRSVLELSRTPPVQVSWQKHLSLPFRFDSFLAVSLVSSCSKITVPFNFFLRFRWKGGDEGAGESSWRRFLLIQLISIYQCSFGSSIPLSA
jgi:hypothetical protein